MQFHIISCLIYIIFINFIGMLLIYMFILITGNLYAYIIFFYMTYLESLFPPIPSVPFGASSPLYLQNLCSHFFLSILFFLFLPSSPPLPCSPSHLNIFFLFPSIYHVFALYLHFQFLMQEKQCDI